MASYLKFAGVIANLQGIVRMDLDPAAPMTLTDLDQRVRRLEFSQSISPPPAVLDPTWESLAWRVCRISNSNSYRDSRHGLPKQVRQMAPWMPFSTFIALGYQVDGDGDDQDDVATAGQPPVTLQKVSDIVYSIRYMPGTEQVTDQAMPPVLKGPEEKDFAHTMQRLMHIAGDRGLAIRNAPTTTDELYALAADVAIHVEAKQGGSSPHPRPGPLCSRPGPGLGPGPSPPGFPVGAPIGRPRPAHIVDAAPYKRRRNKKAASSISDVSLASSRSDRRGGVLRRVFGFGWVKGLMCWRKEHDFPDDNSSRIVD
jgi:hypothetical protein